MPGMGAGMPPPQAPAQPPAASLPADQKTDLDAAEKLKAEANNLFREKKFDEACTKYFAAIN